MSIGKAIQDAIAGTSKIPCEALCCVPGTAHVLKGESNIPTRVMLGKSQTQPDGGVRLLGIPATLDRLIQQAIAQVLQMIWDPTFSEFSYGFRPGRSAHGAIDHVKQYVEKDLKRVVSIDLSKFFDRGNHDRLMSRRATKVHDKPLLKLIRKFHTSGVMICGLVQGSDEGTPQGGPLSPLLSNIVLDELDKELEKRNLCFACYTDDFNIFVRS